MRKQHVFILLTLFLVSFIGFQENPFLALIQGKMQDYTLNNYPEKVYIHTDKPYYSLGEKIWFSAYLLNGSTHEKSTKSKILYAELIDENDSIISQKKLYMKDVNVAGDFTISEKFIPGKYLLRGYTNYMRNLDEKNFFQKEIVIFSSKKEDVKIIKSNIKSNTEIAINIKPELNFYPEGGYLVNDLNNKVAIKIKNNLFDDQKIPIEIIDDKDNYVTSFTTTNFGLGTFFLIPEKGKKYFATLNYLENTYKYELPASLLEGYVIKTVKNNLNLLINLNTNYQNGLLGSSLVIHTRGNLIFNQSLADTEKSKILKIPLSKLPTGVLNITLFTPEKKPCIERLVFINKDVATINIKKAKDYYGRRKKVELNISVKDTSNQNSISYLSMSVRDLNAYPENKKAENIQTWLLLNSDVRGKIKDPGYFFDKNNDTFQKRDYLLDLIMMTNGWRRFTWQNLLYESDKNLEFEVEKGITVSGKTLDMKSPYGAKSVPTRLTLFGKPIVQEPIQISNIKGEFSYGPYILYDSIPALLEARTTNFQSKKEQDRKILILQDKIKKSPKVLRNIIENNNSVNVSAFTNYQKYLKDLDSSFKQQQYVLNEVVVKTKIKSKEEIRKEEMDSRTSYGGSFRRFDAQNEGNGSTALDVLYGVSGINIINDTVYVRSLGTNAVPLILFDEIPIDVIELRSIPATDISFIDLLIGQEAMRFTSGGSVISMYSKLDNGGYVRKNTKRKPGIIDFKINGFYTAKEFYAPDHINGIEEQTKADVRTTLHWNPTIKTSKTADTMISFFTSDSKSSYLIEIEGITENGIPVYATSKIIVE
ncbi:hypothetical protein [uncultured Polaribacter sp.]|uniref:hypothetical protein n=1 Tax=uncultured Polaribacter sp. TaxID=174711 RepID=UPI0030DAEF07|tara:strand:+ start:11918 stop:14374 length:2457 start_codon:yes stop_codon:yes gene_type:complete